jgi:hypothetical protein
MPSVGVATYERLLSLEGMKYDPDLVIISFFVGNDFTDDYTPEDINDTAYFPQRSLLLRYIKKLSVLKSIRNSQSISIPSRHTSGTFHPEEIMYDPLLPTFSDQEYVELLSKKYFLFTSPDLYSWSKELLKDKFQIISSKLEERQIPLYMIVIPDELQVSPVLKDTVESYVSLKSSQFVPDLPQSMLADILPEKSLIVDPYQIFLDSSEPRKFYHPNDSHLSVYGNEVIGNMLHEAVRLDLERSLESTERQ